MKPSMAISLCWVEALWSDTLASRGDIEAVRQDRKRLARARRLLHEWSPISAGFSALVSLVLFVVTSFSRPEVLDLFTAAGAGFTLCIAVVSTFIYLTTGDPNARGSRKRRNGD